MSISDIDLKAELDAMNELFKTNSQNITLPPKPFWVTEDDGLSLLYKEFPTLMKKGAVYWADVVRVDPMLYKPVPRFVKITGSGAAEIVYNHKRSKTADSDPLIMRTFSRYLQDTREKPAEELPEWLREAAAVVKDGFDRRRVIINSGKADGYELKAVMQAIIVFREHLPRGALKNALIPLIAAPYKCESAMILPSTYWTNGFLSYWRK